MEARSLASLNQLASNPPQYPFNPTETKQESLTLYISRVPGTRDVILSTFKPQLKNVTAEDVASSLYYIHLDTSKPEPPVHNAQSHDARGHSSDEHSPSRKAIPRKPLPDTARPPTSDGAHPAPEVIPGKENWSATRPQPPSALPDQPRAPLRPPTATIPGADSGVGFSDPDSDYTVPASYPPRSNMDVPPSKPLGPRSARDEQSKLARKSLPPLPHQEPFTSSERPYLAPTSPSHDHLPEPNYDTSAPSDKLTQSHRVEPHSAPTHDERSRMRALSLGYPPLRPPARTDIRRSPSPKKHVEPFTLRLIRRDPSSGHQWNVGRVSTNPFDMAFSQSDDGSPASRPPIDIVIETSGYAKFRNMPTRKSIDASAPQAVPRSVQQPERGMFSRQVVMSYSKTWSSALRQKFNRGDKTSFGQRDLHRRHDSVDSIFSFGGDNAPVTVLGDPGPGMKPRGYVFASPWDGRCEFRTGNGGRSVRCHHVLREGPTATYNPLVAGQQSAAPAPSNTASSVVSELRFNLPSSELLGPAEQAAAHQRLGNLRRFWKREDGDDYDSDDEVSPFDVNLGRERAGGGNRGKRAKLGKLIVTSDGLKMLDLIVAANIGVWWSAWERII